MARSLATIAACCVVAGASQINNNKAMQDKSKQSHTSTNFYLAVAILITAICMSVGYMASKHYVLQEMIQKNHVPNSTLLHLLEEAKTFLAPVERALAPFKSTIDILFTIVVIELVWLVASPLVPKTIKSFTRNKKETLLGKIEKWIKNLIQRTKNSFKKT